MTTNEARSLVLWAIERGLATPNRRNPPGTNSIIATAKRKDDNNRYSHHRSAWCDCGQPATVHKSSCSVCERCARLEAELYLYHVVPDNPQPPKYKGKVHA